jgi:hypothetical protein
MRFRCNKLFDNEYFFDFEIFVPSSDGPSEEFWNWCNVNYFILDACSRVKTNHLINIKLEKNPTRVYKKWLKLFYKINYDKLVMKVYNFYNYFKYNESIRDHMAQYDSILTSFSKNVHFGHYHCVDVGKRCFLFIPDTIVKRNVKYTHKYSIVKIGNKKFKNVDFMEVIYPQLKRGYWEF